MRISSPLVRPRRPSSRNPATWVISARGAETVFFRYEAMRKIHTRITSRLTTEDKITVMRICRLASALEMPAKISPLIFPSLSLVGT